MMCNKLTIICNLLTEIPPPASFSYHYRSKDFTNEFVSKTDQNVSSVSTILLMNTH